MTPEDLLRIVAWPVLGALAGAAVTFLYNRHLARVKAAIDLHAEFHTESFLKARIRADELLQKHLVVGKNYRLADLHQVCRAFPTSGSDDWAHLSRVLHFFERLNVMQVAGISDRRTLNTLLGSYVGYYRSKYFQHITVEPGDWENLAQSLQAVGASAA
jgi:hypothetical protein